MEKYFTLEEANRALALVQPIVADILSKMQEAETLHAEVKKEKTLPLLSETELLAKLNRVEKLLNDIEYHMTELEEVGAFLKDLKLGLVDFPYIYNGNVVFLCWKLGEEEVHYWHETDSGFVDRKPVDASFSAIHV